MNSKKFQLSKLKFYLKTKIYISSNIPKEKLNVLSSSLNRIQLTTVFDCVII